MFIEETSARELIEECMEVKYAAARDRRVSLEAELDDPRDTLSGDRRLLRTALTNMIETAIRNSRPGGKITVGYHSDPNRESIVVKDNGRGIPYEDLRSIRDLFCRTGAHEAVEGDEIGADLMGLSIVKDVADLHGGRVGVRSVEGEGSVFTMHLPRRQRIVA